MNDYEVEEIRQRLDFRAKASLEDRKVRALEDIADSLLGLVERLDRIGDNVSCLSEHAGVNPASLDGAAGPAGRPNLADAPRD